MTNACNEHGSIMRRASLLCLVLAVLSGCSWQNTTSHTTASESKARVTPRAGATSTAPAGENSYLVRRGDTLYSIAWQQGMDVQQLARLNKIRSPYTIYVGQRLRLRDNRATAGAPVKPPAPAAPVVPRREPLQARPLPPPTPAAQARQSTVPVPPQVTESAAKPPTAKAGTAVARKVPDYDGKWLWPARGKVLRGYQEKGEGRKGIDIAGESGQPVIAAANGRVVYVGSGLVGYGRLIIVKHNESLLSAYGHNSKLLVAEGDHVAAGQTIANMGSSGTNRTMLYFEIRKDGKPVNPMQYLP
jgi:lipoprotein NlpD